MLFLLSSWVLGDTSRGVVAIVSPVQIQGGGEFLSVIRMRETVGGYRFYALMV